MRPLGSKLVLVSIPMGMIAVMCLLGSPAYGQVSDLESIPSKEKLSVSLRYGMGSQQAFPFGSPNYEYQSRFYKLEMLVTLHSSRRWQMEFQLEPAFFQSQHRLMNPYYVQPKHGRDYLEQRVVLAEERTLQEYVFHFGITARYKFRDGFSSYVVGSVGPMYMNMATERMERGFAFSDVVGLGFTVKWDDFLLDFRGSLRHVSNFNLKNPNAGYNSTNFEVGFGYILN